MTYIEKPCRPADREVFLDDAGVLYGHLPAPKSHHLGAECLVQKIERRAL